MDTARQSISSEVQKTLDDRLDLGAGDRAGAGAELRVVCALRWPGRGRGGWRGRGRGRGARPRRRGRRGRPGDSGRRPDRGRGRSRRRPSLLRVDLDRADRVATGFEQEADVVARLEVILANFDVAQPAFGEEAGEDRVEAVRGVVGIGAERNGGSDRTGVGVREVVRVVGEARAAAGSSVMVPTRVPASFTMARRSLRGCG